MRSRLLGSAWAWALVAALSWGACSSGSALPNGEEICDSGESLCGGRCVGTSSDPAHCGSCDSSCGPEQRCEKGECVDEGGEGCGVGRTACDDGCVDVLTDPSHCGGCGESCAEGQACVDGECRTSPAKCDETCAADRICDDGTCVCADGLTDCGVVCAETESDPENCGECGIACPVGASCESGVCICPPGTEICDDACIDTDLDPSHCGACGHSCAFLPFTSFPFACIEGICSFECAIGFADCDGDPGNGCEIDVGGDPAHCGDCGRNCEELPHVVDATCSFYTCRILECEAGHGDCDDLPSNGCETEFGTLSNCGACGDHCSELANVVDAACEEGTCRFGCAEGWEDCDGDPSNGCEADLSGQTGKVCGACDNLCGPDESCTDGACAADPIHANWPLPPDSPKDYDTHSKEGIVIDLVTGLEWERVPPASRLSFEDAEEHCESLDLHGGGWRLPSPVELYSIVDTSRSEPAIDTAAFPETASEHYWTFAPDVNHPSGGIWLVNFNFGFASSHTGSRNVRCVRGSHRLQGERYVIGSETVVDRATGLEWQRSMDAQTLSFANATAACAALRLDGKDDWRLPTVKELLSLFLPAPAPNIDSAVFPEAPTNAWTSTVLPNGRTAHVAFGSGNTLVTHSVLNKPYRCVRTVTP